MPNSATPIFVLGAILETKLGTHGVGDELATGGDTGISIQPPVGETWVISTVTAYGDGVNAGYASLYDGTRTANYILNPDNSIGQGDSDYSCFRDGKIFIDNTNYLYVYNHHAAPQPICYSGEKWAIEVNRGIKADVLTVASMGGIGIEPPAGEVWCVTAATARPSVANNGCIGLDDGGAGSVGYIGYPNIGIGEGDNDYGCFRDGKVLISQDIRLVLFNAQIGSQDTSYSGVQWL